MSQAHSNCRVSPTHSSSGKEDSALAVLTYGQRVSPLTKKQKRGEEVILIWLKAWRSDQKWGKET